MTPREHGHHTIGDLSRCLFPSTNEDWLNENLERLAWALHAFRDTHELHARTRRLHTAYGRRRGHR